jgi:hypothetical protein
VASSVTTVFGSNQSLGRSALAARFHQTEAPADGRLVTIDRVGCPEALTIGVGESDLMRICGGDT